MHSMKSACMNLIRCGSATILKGCAQSESFWIVSDQVTWGEFPHKGAFFTQQDFWIPPVNHRCLWGFVCLFLLHLFYLYPFFFVICEDKVVFIILLWERSFGCSVLKEAHQFWSTICSLKLNPGDIYPTSWLKRKNATWNSWSIRINTDVILN